MSRHKTTPIPATPGRTEAWAVLGYLGAVLRDNGRINVDDWNAAVRVGDELGDKMSVLA